MFQVVKKAFGLDKPADPRQEVQTDAAPTLDELGKAACARVSAAENAAFEMRYQRDEARKQLTKQTARAEAASVKVEQLFAELVAARANRDAARIALREIAAAETPSCANIGKRMARIAREALPEYAAGGKEARHG